RDFLKLAGATTVCGLAPAAVAAADHHVSILLDANDANASSAPVKWAAGQLRDALAAKSVTCEIVSSRGSVNRSGICVVASSAGSDLARAMLPVSNSQMLP